jgi:predicted enzyme related to lactoylglutathione lyase
MIQGQIMWFEIPVKDLDRAILFYSEVLSINVEKIKFLDKELGVFNKDQNTIKGALIEKENYNTGTGVILFLYTEELTESLFNVVKYGGEVVLEKTLLKQKTAEGYLTIKNNMIAGDIGYYAEIIDCEGNRMCLYSNS